MSRLAPNYTPMTYRRSSVRSGPPGFMRWKFLTFGERLGGENCTYLRRWVLDFWLFSVRLHHWFSSDDQRHCHDHPWWYVTAVICGGYVDRSPAGNVILRAPAVAYRPATHRHTVWVPRGGCWTVMFTGRDWRSWGFWVKGKFVRRNKYFFRFGHHQCD